MIIIARRPTPTEVILHGPDALLEWRERRRLPVPGAEFTPAYKRKKWDGTWMPGRWCVPNDTGGFAMRCTVGLANRILRDFNIPIPHKNNGKVEAYMAMLPGTLHDYQRAAVERVLRFGWARIAAATNAGKGAVIAMLAGYAAAAPYNVLIACDEVSVYDALEEQLATWGSFPVNHIRAGTDTPPGPGVTLAMVPTLARRLNPKHNGDDALAWMDWMASQTMVLLDEADKALARTWQIVLGCAETATWRAGFSGTFPEHDSIDDLKLTELLGPVVVRTTNQELVRRGISAKPLVELYPFDVTNELASTIAHYPKGRWHGGAVRQLVYDAAIVRNHARHRAIANLIRPNTPTAIVVNRVEHGRLLAQHIPHAVFLDGSVIPAARRVVLEEFKHGHVSVLIVTKILDRGTNRLGMAADIIFASGEGSTAQTLQRIGRGLRRAGGKEFLRLVDVIDHVIVPDDGHRVFGKAATYLHGGGQRRVQLYRAEGFDTEVLRT